MNEFPSDLYGSDNWSFKRNNHYGSAGDRDGQSGSGGDRRGARGAGHVGDISTSQSISPRPPTVSKRSSSAAMKKMPKFSTGRQYNISRPPLLVELEEFIASQLNELKRENEMTGEEPQTDDWLSMSRLRIYKEAFQRFIEEFNIYKPILTAIKYEYETAFDYFSSKARNHLSTKTEFVTYERQHSQKMAQKDQQHAAVVAALEAKNAEMEEKLAKKAKELQIANAEVDILKIASAKAEAVADEVKQSCITLTNALKRNEIEKKQLVDAESVHTNEILALKVAFHKSSSELERLRLQVHDMESNQSTLVSHEKLERHILKVQDLRDQLKDKDDEHRDLIQRYSLLKNAIEVSCKDDKTQLALKRGSSFNNMSKFDWSDKNVFKKVEAELAAKSSDPR
jgi:chromosome segregation ATPase